MVKQIALFSISILLGLTFIFSAYTKLYPIEPFELTFVDLGIASWRMAPAVARLFIGIEFFAGILLLLNIAVKFTSRYVLILLSLLSIYLFVLLMKDGNTGNCGCFGNYFTMTPLQALIKNVIMMIFTFLLFKYHEGLNYKKFRLTLIFTGLLSSLALPHILNYIDLGYSEAYLHRKEDHFKIELDTLIQHAQVHPTPEDLKKNKQVIAFLSLTCPHCKIAAQKLRIMKEKNPDLPLYFVLNGDQEKINPFLQETKAQNIPYSLLLGKGFVFLAGTNLPSIYFVNNQNVELRMSYLDLDLKETENWLNSPN